MLAEFYSKEGNMNTNLASFIVGLIIDENDRFYFVQKDGQTYALAKEEGQHTVGDTVKGFAYTDMKQKLRLTTLEVTATQDQFGWGTVTEVRKDLGVFVDTGLPDKEIVVSLDILPELKELWPKKGDQLYIRLEVDKKDRIWGLLAYQEDFKRLARPAYNNMQKDVYKRQDQVCSPGGSTIAGVASLEAHAFRGTVMDAVGQAYKRTQELGK